VRDVSNEFERIINIALRKNIYERYQTVREMAGDLQRLRQKLETSGASTPTEVLLRGDSIKQVATERELVEMEPDSLYINLWIEDEYQKRQPTLAVLTEAAAYKFLFAVETWSRDLADATAPFLEPEELKKAPVTKVIVEVLCPFLEAAVDGYIRREVDYYAGRGFPPEAFGLRPTESGRFNLTARLIVKGETIYRDVLGLKVVPAPAEARR
jgi:hypothetical protein